jgi:hypothetical protein
VASWLAIDKRFCELGGGVGGGGVGGGVTGTTFMGGPVVVGVEPGGSGCLPLAMSSVVDFFVSQFVMITATAVVTAAVAPAMRSCPAVLFSFMPTAS